MNNLPSIISEDLDFKKISSKIVSAGIDTKNLKLYFNNYKPIKSYEDQMSVIVEIHSKIIDCIDIYYGIRANQLSEALINNVVKTIFEQFNEISIEEIFYAYDTFTPQKNDWRNVTKQEILKPIYDYLKSKKKVLLEHEKQQKEIESENKRKKDAEDFYKISCDLYNESLYENKWKGDCFNASVIFKRFRDYFTQDEKNDLKKKASELFYKYKSENEIMFYAYSEERILANLVVEKAVENKWILKK